MHHFPGQRNTSQRHSFRLLISGVFPHDRRSPGRDTTAQACRFSCFFCAAYRLLLPQTRAWRSNSASRAIAMLAKPAKICQRSARTSGEICTLIVEGDQSVQIGCSTLLAAPFVERCTRQTKRASKYTSNLYRLRKQRSFPHDRRLSGRDTTAQAFGEIFADFSSIAIARDALFERQARVCVKSNP